MRCGCAVSRYLLFCHIPLDLTGSRQVCDLLALVECHPSCIWILLLCWCLYSCQCCRVLSSTLLCLWWHFQPAGSLPRSDWCYRRGLHCMHTHIHTCTCGVTVAPARFDMPRSALRSASMVGPVCICCHRNPYIGTTGTMFPGRCGVCPWFCLSWCPETAVISTMKLQRDVNLWLDGAVRQRSRRRLNAFCLTLDSVPCGIYWLIRWTFTIVIWHILWSQNLMIM